MLEKFFSDARAIARHREGIFGSYIDAFAADLDGQGYARSTVRLAVWAVARTGYWFADHRFDAADTSEATIAKFCRQDRFADSTRHGSKAALRMLLERLRSIGVVATPAVSETECRAAAQLTDRFARYLRDERSLSEITVVTLKDMITSSITLPVPIILSP